MLKRALVTLAAVVAIASVLAFTASPMTAAPIKAGKSTPAPKSGKKALKILRVDVLKIARDYSHKRFRATCADLTANERKHLGGTSQCMLTIAVLKIFMPIKKFTIITAKLGKRDTQAAVSVYVNGNRKHVIHALVKWEGGQYRLDHESGWHPTI